MRSDLGVATGGAGVRPSPPVPPVIDLVMPEGASVWHVLAGSAIDAHTRCDIPLTWAATRLERGFDPRVVAYRGKTVCLKCRQRRNI